MPLSITLIATGAALGLTGTWLNSRNSRALTRRRPTLVTILSDTDGEGEDDDARQLPALLQQLDAAYQGFFQRNIDPIFSGDRNREMATYRLADLTPAERAEETGINRRIGYMSLALVTAISGTFNAPALLFVSVTVGVYGSTHIFSKAYRHLVHERRISDEVMVSMAVLGALGGGFFIANAVAELLYYTGEKLRLLTENRARHRLVDAWGQLPRTAWLLYNGEEVEIDVQDLRAGDTIVVTAGQIVPADGMITAGIASIDQHMLTGESQPAEKEVGAEVFASTMVLSGRVEVAVKSTGEETIALQITDILNQTASYEATTVSRARVLADRWAPRLLGLGALAGATIGFQGMVAVWNTAIGSNLKITAPIALLNYLNLNVQKGILIKDGRSLELLQDVDTIVFDKTGTLTLEQPTVKAVHAFNGVGADEVLAYAAAAERRQSHPIAHAILDYAEAHGVAAPEVEDVHVEIGYGIRVTLGPQAFHIGSRRFMQMSEIALPPESQALQADCDAIGHSLVYVAGDGALIGAIELEPTLRPEAHDVVAHLHERGLEVVIISGDQEQPTRRLARELGLDSYYANTLPDQKASIVENLQSEGRSVCFVGDGINDSIALKTAHVSVSLRGATTIAMDAAQILLLSQNLATLPTLLELADEYQRNMQLGYATSTLPGLAMIGGVFAFGLGVYPAIAVYNASLVAGMALAMLPSLQLRDEANDATQPLPEGTQGPALPQASASTTS